MLGRAEVLAERARAVSPLEALLAARERELHVVGAVGQGRRAEVVVDSAHGCSTEATGEGFRRLGNRSLEDLKSMALSCFLSRILVFAEVLSKN